MLTSLLIEMKGIRWFVVVMQRVIVSKEEVEVDLDRVRIEIVSTPIGVNSSNLGTICHNYVNGLQKIKFKPEKHIIDEHATKIILCSELRH